MADRELFSELYSSYYQLTDRLLAEAEEKGGISRRRMEEIVGGGFLESTLYLLPKLISGEYNLLDQKGEKFYSKCSGGEPFGLTGLQKSWLKSLLADERMRLFLTDEQADLWKEALKDVEPLYEQEDFYYFDRYLDGDPYSQAGYRSNFQAILNALRERNAWRMQSVAESNTDTDLLSEAAAAREPAEKGITGNGRKENRESTEIGKNGSGAAPGDGGMLRILYRTKKSGLNRFIVVPDQLQYSARDDCFRLSGVLLNGGKPVRAMTFRLSRIEEAGAAIGRRPSEEEIEKCLRSDQPEPVVIRIYPERNALDRCMLHFASYKKQTERDSEEEGTWLCRIYYRKEEETELLIRLLSFGPVIRVLGPERFLELIRERVMAQRELFQKEGFVNC